MCFVAHKQKLFYGQFLLPLSSVYWNQGLNFAKFFTPWSCLHCVWWLQSRSCFTKIFVTWLCRACVRTRGLISIHFITPWSCLQLVLGIVAPEQKSFQFSLPDSVERFILLWGKFVLHFLLPGLVNLSLWLQSRSCFAAILFPDSVERFP